MLMYVLIGAVTLMAIVLIAYFILRRKDKDAKYIRQLQEGTKTSAFSSTIIYQKLYVFYLRAPLVRRYLFKLRRRLEIINIDDEYITRMQSAKILTRSFLIIIPLTIAIVLITKNNTLLMTILLVFELFLFDTFIDGRVDKIDNDLLKQQINFFSEIRHSYHEFNMVEEAIYQTAQDIDNPEMSRQAEKIYEVLISDDPESELEKYYDVAPNAYLKEFAGVSYLTKEFGDRKVDGASLYLKNLNNITQEFQSLSLISIVPILALEPIKKWAINSFSFTADFYNGKQGMLVQILILILTFICYILTRRLKDNGSTTINTKNTENPWQEKLYKIKPIKKFVDLFIPKEGTKDYLKIKRIMKDSASRDKIEWIYINRISLCIISFLVTLIFTIQLHKITIKNVYTDPTATYNIVGEMSDKDYKSAEALTASDNEYIKRFKDKSKLKQKDIENAMTNGTVNKDYLTATEKEKKIAAERIMKKIETVNSEYLSWFEVLIAMGVAMLAYMSPIWLLQFQKKMRQLEMEDEVMQFQTIILMLMRIERVNVEIILEWLERYSNIFKDTISKCVNDYESGPWEALEAMKDDVTYPEFIRIIESLQAAVEKIPIKDAFDELDTEREYYQAKRKESNERLIAKKGRIGKVIGFAPMVVLFVGYLIVPLVFIGLTSMTTSFNAMANM